jgi:hypothetical protein
VTIDGKGTGWGDKGLLVETLAGDAGEVRAPADFDAKCRVAWDARGYDLKAVTNTGLPRRVEQDPAFPFIVIAPQCEPDDWWSTCELNDLLDQVEAKYRVDPETLQLAPPATPHPGREIGTSLRDRNVRFWSEERLCGNSPLMFVRIIAKFSRQQ